MKARGYKEVRYWVPDVTDPAFVRRISEQAPALNEADRSEGTADFLDEVQAETLGEQ